MPATLIKSNPVRDNVSESEWNKRVNLAACYRLMALYGMTDIIYNHITATVDGKATEFLINAYGYHYEEITASSLYKLDVDGNVLLKPDTHYGILKAGFVIHSAVHVARPDIDCVIHTHSRAGTAVSCMKQGLMMVSQTALNFYDNLSYHDFEGAAGNMSERDSLAHDLGPKNYNMVLRNHGLLACGKTIQEAFINILNLESACKIQVDLLASGSEVIEPSVDAMENNKDIMTAFRAKNGYEPEWEAMLRRLDRIDPSYRD